MAFRKVLGTQPNTIMKIYPSDSTGLPSFIYSTDIGHLLMASSNKATMSVGTTADIAQASGILGILQGFRAGVTATTAGSTEYVYFDPISPGELIEADWSTTYSTSLPASTDIGKYLGFPNTTTLAGGSYLSIGTMSNVRGTTSGAFFKIADVNLTKRTVIGTINSSHLAL